jgi:hypothetical protein
MRAFISKVAAASMVAGAALMISACQPKTETTTNDTTVTEMGNETTDTVSDNMTSPDAATMDNGAVSNDTMTVTNTSTTTTKTK